MIPLLAKVRGRVVPSVRYIVQSLVPGSLLKGRVFSLFHSNFCGSPKYSTEPSLFESNHLVCGNLLKLSQNGNCVNEGDKLHSIRVVIWSL